MASAVVTYSAACAGFKIACNGSIVDPSEISAKAKRFCFRTDRINPFTLISWSSKLQGAFCLADWRICAHRRAPERELTGELWLSLATDVAKVRRHVCMAGGGALCCGVGNESCARGRGNRSCGPNTAAPRSLDIVTTADTINKDELDFSVFSEISSIELV